MGESGEDVKLSAVALNLFPFAVECKALAKISTYTLFKQAQQHQEKIKKVRDLDTYPILILKQNNSNPLVVLDFDDFLALLKNS